METVEIDKLRVVDGRLASYQDLGLYEGLIPIPVQKMEDPILHWKGSPIHSELWAQIVSFMKWTYAKYKSESQLRLMYNEDMDVWDVAVLPQHVETGMSSKEIPDHEGRDKVFERFSPNDGWREAGTIHHHCSSSAFQSGTDLADEKEKNGLHITLGDMEQKEVHGFHARASFRRVMYEVLPEEWIAGDFGYYDKAKKWNTHFKVFTSDAIFPEEWKEFLIPKPKPAPITTTRYASGYSSRYGTGVSAQQSWGGYHGSGYDDYEWYGTQTSGTTTQSTGSGAASTKYDAEWSQKDMWEEAELKGEIETDLERLFGALNLAPSDFTHDAFLTEFIETVSSVLALLDDMEYCGLFTSDDMLTAITRLMRDPLAVNAIADLTPYTGYDPILGEVFAEMVGKESERNA